MYIYLHNYRVCTQIYILVKKYLHIHNLKKYTQSRMYKNIMWGPSVTKKRNSVSDVRMRVGWIRITLMGTVTYLKYAYVCRINETNVRTHKAALWTSWFRPLQRQGLKPVENASVMVYMTTYYPEESLPLCVCLQSHTTGGVQQHTLDVAGLSSGPTPC